MPERNQAPNLSAPVLDRAEQIYQAMKKNKRKFIDDYEKDAEKVMRGAAINKAKNQVKKMNNERLKEIIKSKLSEKKGKDLDGDGDIDSQDYLAARDIAIKKTKKSVKEELDYEGEMAKSELYNLIQNAEKLFSMLDEDTQLEAWVQSKLTKANDYLESVYQYLQSQNLPSQPQPMEEEVYYLDK
jgi:hypothetical protein